MGKDRTRVSRNQTPEQAPQQITRKPIPVPDWISKDPSEWPSSARVMFDLMAAAYEREQAAKAKESLGSSNDSYPRE